MIYPDYVVIWMPQQADPTRVDTFYYDGSFDDALARRDPRPGGGAAVRPCRRSTSTRWPSWSSRRRPRSASPSRPRRTPSSTVRYDTHRDRCVDLRVRRLRQRPDRGRPRRHRHRRLRGELSRRTCSDPARSGRGRRSVGLVGGSALLGVGRRVHDEPVGLVQDRGALGLERLGVLRPWWAQNSSSPPSGSSARTYAWAPHRSQRSAARSGAGARAAFTSPSSLVLCLVRSYST